MSDAVMAKVLSGFFSLAAGTVWGCAMWWEGELILRKGSTMWLVATLVAAAVAVLLWRINIKVGAICLMVGCLGGLPALGALLFYFASFGIEM